MSSLSADSPPRARPLPGVRRRGMGFWLMAGVLGLLVFASSAPSPLYGVYQQKWRVSSPTLTTVFGVFSAGPMLMLLLLGGFALAIPAVLAVPESVVRHPGALRSLNPRLGVPRPCLGAFVAGLPGMVALWALGGFYLSLGPSLAGSITGSRNLLWGGVMIVLLTGVGSLSSLLFRNSAPAAAVLWGAVALLAGAGVTVGGIEAPSAELLLAGTAVAGVGFGVTFLGSFRILS